MLSNARDGKKVAENEILALRTVRDDYRHYIVLGDPAVWIRPEAAEEKEI